MKLVLTCEHAFNEIPEGYKTLFSGANKILNSHRGYDPGALDLLEHLKALGDFTYTHKISRLLVEVNRSIGHPHLFSEFTKGLSTVEKNKIIAFWYNPFRTEVEDRIKKLIEKGEKVIHLSVHSFTPILNDDIRGADIGLLYDPSHNEEKVFCKDLKSKLREEDSTLKIRFNYPYLGKADGFTTYLRNKFSENYSGIELEVNQKFVHNNRMDEKLKETVFISLQETLN
ncbi:N-formylglutamate amidohydrolase [Salegentibacter flavus]|uniref:Predicted N-formylglutamate amidohydrolase n=1 Tax=Salegentibacter flavus TaxID=287099 RepID=A0A1I4Z736_9FLAO|nr:N-formylglutamate amidohydrolase [Salegentibacter flavus]SFN46091.1 Predicted N-formylglutamate amidohydrolase [Salegentibacter flavus]